jgi:hypothetical protein
MRTAQSGLLSEPLQAALAFKQSQLIKVLIFLLLLLDILSHGRFISPHRRHPVAPRPKVMAHRIPPPTLVGPCDVDRTLAFDISHHLRHCMLRGADGECPPADCASFEGSSAGYCQ